MLLEQVSTIMSCTPPLHFPQCFYIWYDSHVIVFGSHVIVFGSSLYRFTYQDAYFYMKDRSNTYLLHGEFSLLLIWKKTKLPLSGICPYAEKHPYAAWKVPGIPHLKLSPRPLIPVGVATVQETSVRAALRHFNEFRPEISPVGKWCKDGPHRYCWGPIIPINQVKCQ